MNKPRVNSSFMLEICVSDSDIVVHVKGAVRGPLHGGDAERRGSSHAVVPR